MLAATIYYRRHDADGHWFWFRLGDGSGSITVKAKTVNIRHVMVLRSIPVPLDRILFLDHGLNADHDADPSGIGRRSVRRGVVEAMLQVLDEPAHALFQSCEAELLQWSRLQGSKATRWNSQVDGLIRRLIGRD